MKTKMPKNSILIVVVFNRDWLKGFLARGSDDLRTFKASLVSEVREHVSQLTPYKVRCWIDMEGIGNYGVWAGMTEWGPTPRDAKLKLCADKARDVVKGMIESMTYSDRGR